MPLVSTMVVSKRVIPKGAKASSSQVFSEYCGAFQLTMAGPNVSIQAVLFFWGAAVEGNSLAGVSQSVSRS